MIVIALGSNREEILIEVTSPKVELVAKNIVPATMARLIFLKVLIRCSLLKAEFVKKASRILLLAFLFPAKKGVYKLVFLGLNYARSR